MNHVVSVVQTIVCQVTRCFNTSNKSCYWGSFLSPLLSFIPSLPTLKRQWVSLISRVTCPACTPRKGMIAHPTSRLLTYFQRAAVLSYSLTSSSSSSLFLTCSSSSYYHDSKEATGTYAAGLRVRVLSLSLSAYSYRHLFL